MLDSANYIFQWISLVFIKKAVVVYIIKHERYVNYITYYQIQWEGRNRINLQKIWSYVITFEEEIAEMNEDRVSLGFPFIFFVAIKIEKV